MGNKTQGILLTIVMALAVVFIFFGKIIQDPGNYYFSADGDGFKAYYGAIYHAKYDSSAMRMDGMNYPYGEMVFFTGSQPLVVNAIRLISLNLIDISDHTVAIMNLMMIISIVLAALCIFLVFFELGVNRIYASLVAIGICMLSPQIARLGGHFSLSWLFWIPLMIWLVLRFDKNPNFAKAAVMGLTTFLAGAMHMYFYAFYGFIIGLYMLSQTVNTKRKFGIMKGILYFTVQYLLPFLIFQTIISANDSVTDRTAFPYGFWAYMAHPVGVFLPSGKPYAFVPEILTVFRHVSWESKAFIGVTALSGFIVGIIVFVKRILKKQNPFQVSERFAVNVLFWSSFIALLFSFGLPFKLGLENLVDKVGPLRQLRALARFSWFFFYMLNIVVFYLVGKQLERSKHLLKWRIIALMGLIFLFIEGGWNIYQNSCFIQNERPVLRDVKNELPRNSWVNRIDPGEFQAILPIPYFHVGSENIWVESKNNMQELSMIASLKTGLPTTGVQLSRTSISQTYKNYSLLTEPFEAFEILNDLPNTKPFLLLYHRDHYANEDEARLIHSSELLYQDKSIELRKLELDALEKLHYAYVSEEKRVWKETVWIQKGNYAVNDTAKIFLHKSFDEEKKEETYGGQGAFKYESGNWKNVLNDSLPLDAGKSYKLSFWMSDYKEDGHLRTVLEFVQKDPKSNEVKNYFYSDAHRHIKGFQDNWALIELRFETKSRNESIALTVKNSILRNTKLLIDELVIREEGLDLIYSSDDMNYKNGKRLLFDLE